MRNNQADFDHILGDINRYFRINNEVRSEYNTSRFVEIAKHEKKLAFLKIIRWLLTPNNDPTSPINIISNIRTQPNLTNPLGITMFVFGLLGRIASLIRTVAITETNLLDALNQEIEMESRLVAAKRRERGLNHFTEFSISGLTNTRNVRLFSNREPLDSQILPNDVDRSQLNLT